MTLALNDPAVQAALISSIGSVLAALIAAACAAFIGKQFHDRQKLKDELAIAIGDIAFLLAVEDGHCKLHEDAFKKKMSLRAAAREKGLEWSGNFTPGRVTARKLGLGYGNRRGFLSFLRQTE